MAFDQPTRNRLARFVSEARALLTEEFTRQLQHEYGLDPASGEISPLDRLTALDDARRETAHILRETVDYYLTPQPPLRGGEGERRKEILDRILREQAFTVLNRLCAVRMAEARGFILEAVAQGYRSQGFQLYARLAGSALGETGEAYRSYLFSLFDELAVELPPLFDRFSPQGRLFPRETVLLRLLDLLNAPDLEALWGEDETIGWIYQYFNSKEERQAMRAASQAPRNSRELAVRNQFFTPRYVVEFLTDNTLGRIWYEMTQGDTRLSPPVDGGTKGGCRYLVRRPDEVFLSPMASPGNDYTQDWAMQAADWLQNGNAESFPPFDDGDTSRQRLIQLAAVVDGYQRYPMPQHEQPWALERLYQSLRDRRDFGSTPTQDLLDVMFFLYRSDCWSDGFLLRGNSEEQQTMIRLGNQVRRRFLDAHGEGRSQEDLLRAPVLIPHRPLKDPRDLKMLDPACGSMHFGLYAFDLFEQIYAEAWQLEAGCEMDAFTRSAGLRPLHETYPDEAAFLRDVPRLIIAHNIHGIDIDPRAAQIAGLSLWLRAHKSWAAQGLRLQERPQIRQAHIVCAEPMPGDRAMLEEFLAGLRAERLEALLRQALQLPAGGKVRATPQMAEALAKLVRTVWQEMELAGEAGSLLKIEETLRDAIAQARKQAEEKAPLFRVLEFGLNEPPQEQFVQVLAGDEQNFWDQAEALALAALQEYAEQASNGANFRRRLFAGDAVQGFAFIDLCRKRYDIVLMNPPFGESSSRLIAFLSERFPVWNKNILCAFIECGTFLLDRGGLLASVMDRSLLNKSTYDNFRKDVFLQNQKLAQVLDLGWEVLDANVEVASCVLKFRDGENSLTTCFDVRDIPSEQKEFVLINLMSEIVSSCMRRFDHLILSFTAYPNHSIIYDLPNSLLTAFSRLKNLKTQGYISYTGHQLQSERHFRNYWEISLKENLSPRDNYCHFYNGGEYSRFIVPPREIVRFGNFGILASEDFPSYSYRIQNKDKHFLRGVGFGVRGEYLDAHLLPDELLFSVEGQVMPIEDYQNALFMVGLLNSAVVSRLLNTFAGQHKYSGYVNLLPCPEINSPSVHKIVELVEDAILIKTQGFLGDETCLLFIKPSGIEPKNRAGGFLSNISSALLDSKHKLANLNAIIEEIDILVNGLFGITDTDAISDIKSYATRLPAEPIPGFDANSEKVAYIQISGEMLNYVLGCTFARWDIRYATGEKPAPELPDPFAPLPACPPGMLQNAHGLPAAPEDVPADYPLHLTWGGILADDEGHPEDVEGRVREALHIIWNERSEAIEAEACQILGVASLREYFRKPALFFADHLKRYSKSRRQAPIYWPLSTPSGSYTLWLYYHRLSDQTLFTCVNDFVDPKLKQVNEETARLRTKKGRSVGDEKELERLTDFAHELSDFRAELLRVAAFWKPNLNDGVEITASPLWRLFQHKPWQKRLKETWAKLESGDYDWAHLAYSIWPERVREKCKSDKSLAIAHGVESLYVEPKASEKKKAGKKKMVRMESFFD